MVTSCYITIDIVKSFHHSHQQPRYQATSALSVATRDAVGQLEKDLANLKARSEQWLVAPGPVVEPLTTKQQAYIGQLVGAFKHFLFSIIYGIIIPTWLSYFSEGLKPPTSQIFHDISNIHIPRNAMKCSTISWYILIMVGYITTINPWLTLYHYIIWYPCIYIYPVLSSQYLHISHDGSGWCWYINANIFNGILMVKYGIHVTIYSSTMDPMGYVTICAPRIPRDKCLGPNSHGFLMGS